MFSVLVPALAVTRACVDSVPARNAVRCATGIRMLSCEDLSKLTVVQLKERLRAASLPVSGRKAELIERLLRPPADPAPASAAALLGQRSTLPAIGVMPTDSYPAVSIEACKS